MKNLLRIEHQFIAKIITRFPSLSKKLIDSVPFLENMDIPWTPVSKPLRNSKVALVTTSGVHHRDQEPFDMDDINGDPTYRSIDVRRPLSDLMITHDYYDHKDADKDINIVFPVERLKEFQQEGYIGMLADIHYSFMGHIIGHHIDSLRKYIAPEVSIKLIKDHVDIVLLTPG